MLSLAGTATPRVQTTASASAPDVTAAYLLNFIKFVDWPADVLDLSTPLTLCVADDRVAEALNHALAGRPAGGRPVELSRVTTSSIPAGCRVVYLGDVDSRSVDEVLSGLRGRAVLSVSSTEDFARRGGTVELFMSGDGTMKFAVNPKAAENARLRVDSRLLKLARIVAE